VNLIDPVVPFLNDESSSDTTCTYVDWPLPPSVLDEANDKKLDPEFYSLLTKLYAFSDPANDHEPLPLSLFVLSAGLNSTNTDVFADEVVGASPGLLFAVARNELLGAVWFLMFYQFPSLSVNLKLPSEISLFPPSASTTCAQWPEFDVLVVQDMNPTPVALLNSML